MRDGYVPLTECRVETAEILAEAKYYLIQVRLSFSYLLRTIYWEVQKIVEKNSLQRFFAIEIFWFAIQLFVGFSAAVSELVKSDN